LFRGLVGWTVGCLNGCLDEPSMGSQKLNKYFHAYRLCWGETLCDDYFSVFFFSIIT